MASTLPSELDDNTPDRRRINTGMLSLTGFEQKLNEAFALDELSLLRRATTLCSDERTEAIGDFQELDLANAALADGPCSFKIVVALLHSLESLVQRAVSGLLFYRNHGRLVQSKEDVIAAWQHFLRVRVAMREEIGLARTAAENTREEGGFRGTPHFRQVMALRDLAHKQQVAKRPSDWGTVAEISAKYGLSKSEVRRLKQDGTLDAVLSERHAALAAGG